MPVPSAGRAIELQHQEDDPARLQPPGSWSFQLRWNNVTHANPGNYRLAAEMIESGAWQVDATRGLVFGKRDEPFRRTNSWGYIQIKFREPGNWRSEHAALAHRVIWESVFGPLPVDLTINHIDGDKQNNQIINLEAVTQGDNVRHAHATGLKAGRKGEANAQSLLSDDEVRAIYELAWQGVDQAIIGARFGIGRGSVSNIKQGWAWSHVTGRRRQRQGLTSQKV